MSLQALTFTMDGVSTYYEDFFDTLACAFQSCQVTALFINCPERDLDLPSL